MRSRAQEGPTILGGKTFDNCSDNVFQCAEPLLTLTIAIEGDHSIPLLVFLALDEHASRARAAAVIRRRLQQGLQEMKRGGQRDSSSTSHSYSHIMNSM